MAVDVDRLLSVQGYADSAANRDRYGMALAAAQGWVERYAPDAPESVKDLATYRLAVAVSQPDSLAVESEKLGPREATYFSPMVNAAAARNSGAAWLLSAYRVRRAGAV